MGLGFVLKKSSEKRNSILCFGKVDKWETEKYRREFLSGRCFIQ